MRDSIWNKRIPTLLGLLIISIGIVITSILVKTGVITIQYAAPSETPENVRITNVAGNSFTVSYTTQAQVLGSLAYGTTSDYGSVGYDDRDQKTGGTGEYKLHYITVKNVKPSTLYFFSITSGKNTYLHNDTPFQVTTGPIITEDPPKQSPASGKILSVDGTPPQEAAVYLSADGSQTISSFIQADGSYILPLNSLRTQDLSSYAKIQDNQKLQELVMDATQKSNIAILVSQINPIPAITLSQDYDFTAQNTPLASPSAQTSFPSFTTSLAPKAKPQILTPKTDQGFTDTQPMFKGTAQPGEDVQITVHSEQVIKTTVMADQRGNWAYRPDANLAPGEHTITIVTRNASGILQTIQKSFTVYAAGTQVSQSATPSATVTPKPTTKIPTPTPTAIPTLAATPTISLPTPTTIVMAVTTAPTPTILAKTKGGQKLEPGSESTTILGLAAIITTSFGILLFFFSRKNISV
jgi:hypothetical protein